MVKLIFFLMMLLLINALSPCSVAQSVRQAKTSLGSGTLTKNQITISSSIAQPSPVTAIGTGSIKLLQGFQTPLLPFQESAEKHMLNIFPNPTHGNIVIELTDKIISNNYRIVLHDNVGRVVSSEISSAKNKRLACDFTSVAIGIYHLQLYSNAMLVGSAKIFIK